MNKLPAHFDLGGLLEDRKYDGGVKIIIRATMRAPINNGELTLEPCWIAEVYARANMRVPLIKIVDAEAAGLFAQMAMLAKSGEVEINQADESRANF